VSDNVRCKHASAVDVQLLCSAIVPSCFFSRALLRLPSGIDRCRSEVD
jgi:hypothetical protein